MITTYQISERRAGYLARLSRDAYYHPPVMSEKDQALQDAIVAIARHHRRFGNQQVIDLLRVQCFTDNHKYIFRLY